MSEESQYFIQLLPSAQYSSQIENFVSTSKNLLKKHKFSFSRSVLFHMKTKVGPKYFVNDCSSVFLWRNSSPQLLLTIKTHSMVQ